ncbi:hypothetical protein SAMN06265784_11948 [Paraburkholderia susongensis]|uniref:Uncharacterized protein n=1 Tax=Paraburkholderia susongensis TaxID=1515439 RepID=A0A1X7M5Q4_9BURK|nr:hypothetical protein SAMN06265784_11948 [Paraburkholderia susongensis]
MQVDLQAFVEPEHGILPGICMSVVNSFRLASPKSVSIPSGSLTCPPATLSISTQVVLGALRAWAVAKR